MQARHLALVAGAALVAAGGLYLFFAVRSSEVTPPAELLEAARQRHQRSADPGEPGDVAQAPRVRRHEPADDAINDPLFAKSSDGRPRRAPGIPQPDETSLPTRGGSARRVDDPAHGADSVENPDIDAALAEANKAYDRKDFETARNRALALLEKQVPGNIRMLRVVVSSSCILGEIEVAKKYYDELPQRDRDQMTRRCAQYGITLP